MNKYQKRFLLSVYVLACVTIATFPLKEVGQSGLGVLDAVHLLFTVISSVFITATTIACLVEKIDDFWIRLGEMEDE